jgi:hypothetical protein
MKFNPASVVGRRKPEAMALITAASLRCRVIKEEGCTYVMPPDHDCNRILLEIEAGVVRNAAFG